MSGIYHVGIGGLQFAQGEGQLVTHALGSCIAVVLYEENSAIGAMIHAVLPTKGAYTAADSRRGYYVDTGLTQMIQQFLRRSEVEPQKVYCALVGGTDSSVADPFKVGLRNVEMAQAVLKAHTIVPDYIETGGMLSRTVIFSFDDRALTVLRQKIMG